MTATRATGDESAQRNDVSGRFAVRTTSRDNTPTTPVETVSHDATRHTSSPGGVSSTAILISLTLGIAAFALRSIGLSRSFELWVDEMLYADLGASVSRGEIPNLPDGPFFLHPPGFFLVEGTVMKILGINDDPMSMVYDLRWLNATLGALTIALAFLLVRRVAGTRIAWFSAIILVFEPFVLRNNSRVFLETLAGAAALAGLLILASYLGRPRAKRAWLQLASSGLFLGYAVFTKDVFIIYTIVPLLLAIWWRKTLRPAEGAIVMVGIASPYTAYLVVLASTSHIGEWAHAKTAGIARLFGAVQTTGFNAPNAPSLISRLIVQVGEYGTSYVLLLACPVAGALACLSHRPERRLIGLSALAMGLFGTYVALFGTFEEQYGYGIMLASVTALAVCAAELIERRPAMTRPVLYISSVFLVLTVTLGSLAEATSDDGYLQFRAWVAAHLPADAHISVTNSTARWAFEHHPRFGVWPTAAALEAHGSHYILTQSLPASEGYDYEPPEMYDWLSHHAAPVFRTTGPTNGDTIVWFIDQPTLEQAVRLNVGTTTAGER
jgi:hypothetical protein